MYGNVDAAIKFFKTLTAHITKDEDLQLKQSKTDPCVFYKLDFNNNLILIVSVTVDDCAITGTNKDIDWFMDGLEKRFKITRDGILSKHLGVHYDDPVDIDEYRSLVGQVMFFTTKVGLKTGAATRALSAHMSNPGPSH